MQQTFLILAATATLAVAGGSNDAEKQEREKLRGTWAVTELMEGNRKAPDEKAKSLRIEFNGEAITITIKGQAAVKGTCTVNPKTAVMNITYDKDGKTVTIPALYELKGDHLKICHANAEGGNRPDSLESTAQTVLMTLKRQKS